MDKWKINKKQLKNTNKKNNLATHQGEKFFVTQILFIIYKKAKVGVLHFFKTKHLSTWIGANKKILCTIHNTKIINLPSKFCDIVTKNVRFPQNK